MQCKCTCGCYKHEHCQEKHMKPHHQIWTHILCKMSWRIWSFSSFLLCSFLFECHLQCTLYIMRDEYNIAREHRLKDRAHYFTDWLPSAVELSWLLFALWQSFLHNRKLNFLCFMRFCQSCIILTTLEIFKWSTCLYTDNLCTITFFNVKNV